MTTRRRAGSIGGGTDGQVLILTAVALVALMGIASLSIDASLAYDRRNRLYSAADAAAKSGAIEVRRNPGISASSLLTFADDQVVLNGFDLSTTNVAIHRCSDAGATCGSPYTGSSGYVEALVSQQVSTVFGRVLGALSFTPGARAVAGAAAPSSCIYTTQDLTIRNSALTLNGCGIAIGGNISPTNPNSRITGSPMPPVGVAGSCTPSGSGQCSAMGALETGMAFPTDLLASLPAPPDPGGCVAGTSTTLGPGCYTSISSSVQTLTAGTYYVTGTIDIGSLTGTHVLIYLTGGGNLQASNNKSLTLSAPTSGTYSGIAIFQDAADANNFATGNNFTLAVTGAIYMPGTDVAFPNSLSIESGTCSLFYAHSLDIRNGNGAFNVSGCASTFGGAAFLSVGIAE